MSTKTTKKKDEHGPAAEHHVEHAHEHDDELIVVPKGRSKLYFYGMLALLVFILLIFTVGDQLMSSVAGPGNNASATYMSWQHPTRGVREMTYADFIFEKRRYADLIGMLYGGRQNVSDDQTATWVVLDELAQDAGIAITDTELNEWIVGGFGSGENYRSVLQSYGETPKNFEKTLRRQLRVERYRSLVMAAAGQFDPDVVERQWRARHQEYRFDYVALPVADVKAEAENLVPADDELATWYQVLPPYMKTEYNVPAEVRGEVIALSFADLSKGQKLLEAFPGEEVEDPETRARGYYQGFSYVRFKRENPDLSGGVSPAVLYLPYEEVEEACLAEAPLYDAMTAFHKSLVERIDAGETIDLAAEAAALGLEHGSIDELSTVEEIAADERSWTGRYVAQSMIAAEVGKLSSAPMVEPGAFVIGLTTGKVEEREPTFDEVREEVIDAWVEERSAELAQETLEAARDALGERPPEGDPTPFRPEVEAEAFRTAMQAAGYEVQVRDWLERTPPTPPSEASSLELFFRTAAQLYGLREGVVGEALLSRDEEAAYLVRVDGVRDPENAVMKSVEIQQLRTAQEREARTAFEQRTFASTAFLRDKYSLWLESWAEQGS